MSFFCFKCLINYRDYNKSSFDYCISKPSYSERILQFVITEFNYINSKML